MPEPTGSPAATAPAAPSVDLSGIQDSIKGLSEQIGQITEQLDTFGADLEEVKNPTPATPQPKWKPRTWDEFPQMAAHVAREVIRQSWEEHGKAQEETRKQAEAQQAQYDQEFDTQLATLEASGKIPKIADPNNPNDPGRVVRKELFGLGIVYKSPDLLAMADLREQLAASGMRFDPDSRKVVKASLAASRIPMGQTAPVGSSARTTGFQGKPSYKEIHGLSMDEMVRRFNEG